MEDHTKNIKINIPQGTDTIEVVDNSTDFKVLTSSSFKIATESINKESNNSLSRKGIKVCEDFITGYDKLGDPIYVEISRNNDSLLVPISIKENNSILTMTGYGYVMDIQEGVLEKFKKNEIGDLNFLVLSFCLKIFSRYNRIKFLNQSNDKKHIKKSFKTFEKLCTKIYKKK